MTLDRPAAIGDRLALGRLPWRTATQFIAAAGRCLAALHAQRRVHGRVSSATILIDRDGAVSLADGAIATADLRALADVRSDLAGLGATYFTLLTGTPPFGAPDATGAWPLRDNRPVPNVRAGAPEIPLRCSTIIDRALTNNPAEAYPDAAAMLDDLEAVLAVDDRPFVLPPEVILKGKPSRRWRYAIIAGIVLAVGSGGVGWWLMWPADDAAINSEPDPANPNPADFLPTISNSIGMTLARVPAGDFVMGDAFAPDARPHRVRISRPFCIGTHEVTQAQYRAVMNRNPSNFRGDSAPVEDVSWDDANAFCEKLSATPAELEEGRRYRLPTEAEWEYACRAGTRGLFSFGSAFLPHMANTGVAGLMRPVMAGTFPPNRWGLSDMHGNVWEWCADWYAPDYYQHSPIEDPPGPEQGVKRVTRGGAWDTAPEKCRASYRNDAFAPDHRGPTVGFRVVCELTKDR